MAIALGEDFLLEVETTTPGTFVPVLGMDEWEQNDSQTIDTFPTFGATTPLGIPTPPDISFSISGFFDPVDPGQVRLRTIAREKSLRACRRELSGDCPARSRVRSSFESPSFSATAEWNAMHHSQPFSKALVNDSTWMSTGVNVPRA